MSVLHPVSVCFQVLNFVRVSLESHRVNLLSFDGDVHGPGEENLPLLVDNTLKEFTISVSGEKPKIHVCLLGYLHKSDMFNIHQSAFAGVMK